MCHLLPGLPPQGNLSAHCWFVWTSESMEGTRMEPGWWQSGAMINLDINIKLFISSWIITMETEIWISKINNQYHRLWPKLLWASEGSGPTGPIWLHFHLVSSISFTKSWQHIHFIKFLVQKTLGFMPHTHTHSLNAWASHQAWFLACVYPDRIMIHHNQIAMRGYDKLVRGRQLLFIYQLHGLCVAWSMCRTLVMVTAQAEHIPWAIFMQSVKSHSGNVFYSLVNVRRAATNIDMINIVYTKNLIL